ncbi:MAG: 2-dehydro-3-deoxyphosphogluconate aldolase [Thermoanaerobaculia bacterium]|nr:2-dehydro-3-deoxyphosphogluconate aldolase [Thermoanaerobaculia bacterium]
MERRQSVARSFAGAPVVGVVRTGDRGEAARIAQAYLDGGLELIEVTFTVPGAEELAAELLARRGNGGPPWIGMGTVTTPERAARAAAAGADFLVSPNAGDAVAEAARRTGLFVVLGALTPTEIVRARDLGADLVKVYPLPPVGGAAYLATVRQPLDDVPLLAAGGFPAEEIPVYRQAGAVAFGLGAPQLLADTPEGSRRRIGSALAAARGEASA